MGSRVRELVTAVEGHDQVVGVTARVDRPPIPGTPQLNHVAMRARPRIRGDPRWRPDRRTQIAGLSRRVASWLNDQMKSTLV